YFPASEQLNVMSVSMGRYVSWIERILGSTWRGSLDWLVSLGAVTGDVGEWLY
ncbi:hypothetical protein Tco_0372497, partial [Tanacetum coccineum]